MKKSKMVRPFGFVHFSNLVSIAKLEEALDKTWIGTYKLQVNLSRFVDEEKFVPQGSIL